MARGFWHHAKGSAGFGHQHSLRGQRPGADWCDSTHRRHTWFAVRGFCAVELPQRWGVPGSGDSGTSTQVFPAPPGCLAARSSSSSRRGITPLAGVSTEVTQGRTSSRANGHERLGRDTFGFMSILGHSLSARSVAVAHSGRSFVSRVHAHRTNETTKLNAIP